jgi:hypothetical protein
LNLPSSVAPQQNFCNGGRLKDHHDGRRQARQECFGDDAGKDDKAAGEFDGEFAENSTKYSGMGRLRYTW